MSFPPFISPLMGRGSGFSPRGIASAKVWFTADDSSTITFSSGTNVATWTDKIGGYVMTMGGSGSMVYTATDSDHNGKPSIGNGFSSGPTLYNSYMSCPDLSASGWAGATTWTLLSEFKCVSGTTNGVGNVLGFSGLSVGWGNGSGPPAYALATCSTSSYYAYTNSSYSGTSAVYEWDNANYVSSHASFLQNGNQLPETGGNATSWYDPGNVQGWMFARPQAATQLVYGTMAETILLINPSMSDIYKAEGYLAWKYGRQASLPAGHAYKSSAPTSEYDNDNFEQTDSGLLVPRKPRLLVPGFRLAA